MLIDIKNKLFDNTMTIEKLELKVSKFLFTNAIMVNLLNSDRLPNIRGGTYSIINIYNPSLPIKFDKVKNEYYTEDGYEMHPVCGISWTGAQKVANLLGGRLPTEREWEYLARSGYNNRIYPWGNVPPSCQMANYDENVGSTTPVDRYDPNELGLYDMAGNAEEWCLDSFYENKDNIEASVDEKIVKGGSWNKDPSYLLIGSRRGKWCRIGTVGISFRVVCEIKRD